MGKLSSNVVSETIITIAVVIAASIFAAAFTTTFQSFTNAQNRALAKLKEEVEVKVEIVFISPENGSKLRFWIKNVGCREISQPLIGKASDLFLERRGGSALRVSYQNPEPPTWNYTLLNDLDEDGRWDPGETLEVTVNLPEGNLTSGDWLLRYITYNGAIAEGYFSV